MRFIFTLFLSLLLFVSQSFAGLPPTRSGGQSGSMTTTFDFKAPFNQATKYSGTGALLETGNTNLLKNPGFEAATYSTSWTASGGSSAVGTTTNIGSGSKSYTWDSSGAAQTLVSDAITIPEAIKGLAGEASCYIKVPSGTATHKIQVWDGSSAVAEKLISTETTFVQNKVSFTIPTSGTIAVRLLSVASNEPSISIDDCYIGRERGPPDTVNYLNYNPDAEQGTGGWATYADAAATTPVDGTGGSPNTTWTRTTSTPLRGAGSFLLTHASGSSRQGEGVSYDFTIDKADKGKPIRGNFDYAIASGTYTDDDLQVFVYDVTNSTLIYPSPAKIKNHTLDSEAFPFEFQAASNSTSYRLIIHTVTSGTANAFTVKFDNFKVGQTPKVFGAVVTDWVAYTPTFTGFGTVTNTSCKSRKNGANLEVLCFGTSGTVTATEARVTLGFGGGNANVTISPDIPTPTAGQAALIGSFASYNTGTNQLTVLGIAGNNYVQFGLHDSGLNGLTPKNGNAIMTSSGQDFSFFLSVPITGWSSSQLLSSDASTREITARYSTTAGQSISNGVEAVIDFDTKIYDKAGEVTTGASWKYTASVPGRRRIAVASGFATASFTSGNAVYMGIYKNGSLYSYLSQVRIPSTGNSSYTLNGADTIDLVAGDYVQIKIAHGESAARSLISAAGYNYISIEMVQGPSQIAASETIAAHYDLSSSQSISNNTTSTLVVNTKVVDTHGGMDTSTGIYTIQANGIYSIRGTCLFSTSGTVSTGYFKSVITKNGTGTVLSEILNMGNHNIATYSSPVADWVGSLVAGDTVRLLCGNSGNGAAANAIGGTGNSSFRIFRVGM